METIELSSDEARQDWGPTIDKVDEGKVIVVTRYNRPRFVWVKYSQWEEMLAKLEEVNNPKKK